jgi:outer membrane protein TolC
VSEKSVPPVFRKSILPAPPHPLLNLLADRLAPRAAVACSIALALLAVPAGAQSVQANRGESATFVLSIDQAVDLALKASPEVVRGLGASRVARATERSARGAFLPSVDLESNTIRASTPSPIGQPGVFGGVVDRTGAAGLTSS